MNTSPIASREESSRLEGTTQKCEARDSTKTSALASTQRVTTKLQENSVQLVQSCVESSRSEAESGLRASASGLRGAFDSSLFKPDSPQPARAARSRIPANVSLPFMNIYLEALFVFHFSGWRSSLRNHTHGAAVRESGRRVVDGYLPHSRPGRESSACIRQLYSIRRTHSTPNT